MNVKLRRFLIEAKRLLGDQLWELPVENFSKAKRNLVRFIKLTRITFNEFAVNRMGFQCVALSYLVVLSIVPFVAFVFAVGDGLGYHEKIASLLYTAMPNYPDVIGCLLDKAEVIISTAQSGGVGLISALFFFWTIIWLMFQVERVFNNVWKINKINRSIYKRFSFYIGLLLLSPLVVVIFGTGIVLYTNLTGLVGMNIDIEEISVLLTILGWFVMYIVTVFTLSAMYKYIPATKVYYRNAFW